MDALSWISLTMLTLMALGVAAIWLRGKRVGQAYSHRVHLSTYGLGTLLLVGFLLVAVEGFTEAGMKEVVFDGWLDSVVDTVDGTDDREEWMVRQRERGGGGFVLGA